MSGNSDRKVRTTMLPIQDSLDSEKWGNPIPLRKILVPHVSL